MKQRNPLAVIFLPLVTFGIYSLVWEVKTKNEMNQLGADIPTAWLLVIPFVNYYWLWKYCLGVEKTTNNSMSAVMAFVLVFLLGNIGAAIIQNEFNKLGTTPALASTPGAWQAPAANNGVAGSPFAGQTQQTQPDNSFGGPVAPPNPVVTAINPVVMPESFAPNTPTVVTPEQPVATSQPAVMSPTSADQPVVWPVQPPTQA